MDSPPVQLTSEPVVAQEATVLPIDPSRVSRRVAAKVRWHIDHHTQAGDHPDCLLAGTGTRAMVHSDARPELGGYWVRLVCARNEWRGECECPAVVLCWHILYLAVRIAAQRNVQIPVPEVQREVSAAAARERASCVGV
jgi:hypothetical protein